MIMMKEKRENEKKTSFLKEHSLEYIVLKEWIEIDYTLHNECF